MIENEKKPLLLVFVALWVTYLCVASTVCASANLDAPRLLHRTQTIESYAKPTRFNETALDVDKRLLKELAFNRLSRISIPVLDTDIVFTKKYHANRTKTSTWIGKDAAGEHTLVLTLGENHFFGKVIGPGNDIVFQPSGVGSRVVSKQLDPRFEVPLIDDDVMAPQTRDTPDAAVNIFDDGTRIDVMVLYTVGMANAYPGSQIDTRIQYLIDLSNLALSNSLVNTQINLVYSQVVNYPDDSIGDMSEALDDLTNNVGVFTDIEALRTAYGADQVTLLRRFADEGCGMAWLLQQSGNSRYAYSVVHNGSKTGGSYCDDLTFIHELGHNLGCQHDRGNSGTTEGRFPYSYGYQDPDRAFRTVMAYNCIGGCPRIQYFSNPDLSYQARPVGISEIYPNAANNAKTINSTRVGMAAYRASSTPFIQVNSPNGGESWRIGKTYPITWKASNLDSYVTIELYQAGILQSPALASGIPNAGTYTWFISSQFSPGADYSIRVKGDASGATIFDDSDHSFTLISIRRSPQAMPWIDLLLRDP